MPQSLKYLVALPLLGLLPLLAGCGSCGFDCSDDNDQDAQAASLTLGFSDAPLEELKKVVIEVTAIEFRRDGVDPLVVETFDLSSAPDMGRFKIDLLQFPGTLSQTILTGLTVPADFYDEIFVAINGDDASLSYVLDGEDMARILRVNDGGLSLPGRQIDADNQDITVEFGLARALKFNANDDSYTLEEDGIRLVDDTLAPSLAGTVDPDLFDAVDECEGQDGDDTRWNRVYLYEGTGLDQSALADVFDPGAEGSAGRIAPYAAAPLVLGGNGWQFFFGYLPSNPDGYTLAFSCNAKEDNARTIEDITVPLPAAQIIEVSLDTQDNVTCEFELDQNPSC